MNKLLLIATLFMGFCLSSFAQNDDDFYYEEPVVPQYEGRNWGGSFSIMGGVSIPTLDMHDYCKVMGEAQIDLSARYKKYLFGIQFVISGGTLKRDLEKKDGQEFWEKNSNICLGNVAFYTGYIFYDSQYFRVTPHLFCGINEVSDGNEDEEETSVNYKSATLSWGPGCALDIKLRKLSSLIEESVAIRINYQYNSSDFKRKYIHASGSLHVISIGMNITL